MKKYHVPKRVGTTSWIMKVLATNPEVVVVCEDASAAQSLWQYFRTLFPIMSSYPTFRGLEQFWEFSRTVDQPFIFDNRAIERLVKEWDSQIELAVETALLKEREARANSLTKFYCADCGSVIHLQYYDEKKDQAYWVPCPECRTIVINDPKEVQLNMRQAIPASMSQGFR